MLYKIEKQEKKIILTSLKKTPIEKSLIWLHGFGGNPEEFINFFNQNEILPKNFRIILLRAPKKLSTLNKK